MIDSLYIAATGMSAQQLRIDTISNNVSNVSTTGFKKGRVSFEDLFYRRLNPLPVVAGTASDLVGLGTAVTRTDKVFSNGDLVKTGNPLDVAIKGQGFLEVTLANGDTAHARPGSLALNDKGDLVTQSGEKLTAKVQIPADATQVNISTSGGVTALVPDQAEPLNVGQIELVNFINPAGLEPLGGGIYATTSASGEPFTGIPGENGLGTLAQGYVESSNVDLVDELVNLTLAQRAYQLNSKVLQVSDDILSTINSLRR